MDGEKSRVYDRPPLMFTRTLDPRRLLRSVYGTEPFVAYCESRNVLLEQVVGFPMHDEDFRRWQDALRRLPEAEQARVELEMAQVHALANPEALALLLSAAESRGLPPEAIPDGAALALWFFLHHPQLFQEAFLRREIADLDSWRTARAPAGIALDDLERRRGALAATLRDFFRGREGTGRFCAVDAYPLDAAYCFIAHVSDRLRLFEVFTDEGHHTTKPARPAVALAFAYYPEDGRLLVKSRLRARGRILDLVQRFGRAALGVHLGGDSLAPAFRLDCFKHRFDPPLGASGVLSVRVRSLHCAYPGREGRWRVKLETLAGDRPFAILDLLREHGGSEAVLEQLVVVYVELELAIQAGGASQVVLVRLWPDRCSLDQTPLGERLRACLRRWGISDA